jgi:hypothetical protein
MMPKRSMNKKAKILREADTWGSTKKQESLNSEAEGPATSDSGETGIDSHGTPEKNNTSKGLLSAGNDSVFVMN